MADDLVKRLRYLAKDIDAYESKAMAEAADRIEELRKLCEELRLAHWHLSEALTKMTALALERKD
jgi:hypothetical protein